MGGMEKLVAVVAMWVVVAVILTTLVVTMEVDNVNVAIGAVIALPVSAAVATWAVVTNDRR